MTFQSSLPDWAERRIAKLRAEEPKLNGQVILNFHDGEIASLDVRAVIARPKVDKSQDRR